MLWLRKATFFVVLPDTLLIRTLLLLLIKPLRLPIKCLYGSLFFSPNLLSFAFLICKKCLLQLCLPQVVFFSLSLPLPKAVVCGIGAGVCHTSQLVKGISKALAASQVICSLSAQAGFCKSFLHKTFSD